MTNNIARIIDLPGEGKVKGSYADTLALISALTLQPPVENAVRHDVC